MWSSMFESSRGPNRKKESLIIPWHTPQWGNAVEKGVTTSVYPFWTMIYTLRPKKGFLVSFMFCISFTRSCLCLFLEISGLKFNNCVRRTHGHITSLTELNSVSDVILPSPQTISFGREQASIICLAKQWNHFPTPLPCRKTLLSCNYH